MTDNKLSKYKIEPAQEKLRSTSAKQGHSL